MLPAWRSIGISTLAIAAVTAPRPAAAHTDLSLRVPVGVAFDDGARFELGLRSDLLYFHRSAPLGFGISGEVRSVSFDTRAQELNTAFALMEDHGAATASGLVLDAGYGTDPIRRYVHLRSAYQLRVLVPWDEDGAFAYAVASAVFVDLRRTVSGPGGWEAVAGVEIGGGLTALYWRIAASIAAAG
jgi:hypothetical protein